MAAAQNLLLCDFVRDFVYFSQGNGCNDFYETFVLCSIMLFINMVAVGRGGA